MPYRPNVSIIAQKDNQFLIVHKPRQFDAWQFPQGGIEEGETVEQSALREFIEELGTNKIQIIKKSPITYQYDFPEGYVRYTDSGKEFKGQKVTFLLARFWGADQDIKLDKKELDDYQWVEFKDFPQYFKRAEYLEVCKLAIGN